MRLLIPLLLLVGCTATHQRAQLTSFDLLSDSPECVWVVRREFVKDTYDAGYAVDHSFSAQTYLYLCCPTEPGEKPLCLNPQWAVPSNIRRPTPSLEELEAEVERTRR
jgi:hypothetical protein